MPAKDQVSDDKYKEAKSWNKSQTRGHIRKSVFYDKIDRVLGTRDISTMKHVVEAGTSTASPSSLSANPPSDHDGSQPGTRGKPSPPESSIASSGISGTSNEISDAEVNPWPVPAYSAGKKGSAQLREKCRPKMPERKRQFPSRKASNPWKSNAKSSLRL